MLGAMRFLIWLCLMPAFAVAQELEFDDLAVPSRTQDPPLSHPTPFPVDRDLLRRTFERDGKLWVTDQGVERQLTIDARLQSQLTTVLRAYETPYAAVVALEPNTGRVLAMSEHSQVDPSLRSLSTRALFPAASIFKLVTAAALLVAGISPDEALCSFGGKRKVSEGQLDDSSKDRRCLTLSRALALSANVIFAKFTARYLDAERLKSLARAFRFNVAIPFPVPTEASLASIPQETFPLALTGAGFGDIYLSPLHGAALAAVAANQGRWQAPVLFEGEPSSASFPEQVIPEAVAAQLQTMMEETITDGTARRVFRERGLGIPGAVGKTGSLADKTPYRDYSWFVGFAPKENPRIAVAAVVVNEPRWRIRATWLGREAMRLFLTKGDVLVAQ
jgi:cell division protein FtsI/penicillin-binding protein 2